MNINDSIHQAILMHSPALAVIQSLKQEQLLMEATGLSDTDKESIIKALQFTIDWIGAVNGFPGYPDIEDILRNINQRYRIKGTKMK